jgi:hypothetical protein
LSKTRLEWSFDRILAHRKLPGDLAVAQSLGYQFEDLKLTARNAEVLPCSLIRDDQPFGRDRDFFHRRPLPGSSQLEPEPDTKNSKSRRGQSTVDFD